VSYEHATAHMNADHAAALLDIVRAYGSVPEATSARIVLLEDDGMDVEAEVEDGAARHTRVPFEPPITEGTVRERLVELARRAGEALGKN
jgi:putative heme iron utilization protein